MVEQCLHHFIMILLNYNVNENLSLKPYFENDNLTNSSSIGFKLKLSL